MTIILQDTFTRANVASGWGTGTDGHTWVLDNAPTGTQSVSSNEGLITNSGTGTVPDFIYGSSVTTANAEGLVRVKFTNTGDECLIILRHQSAGNYYYAGYDAANGKQIKKRVTSTGTSLAAGTFTATINVFYWIRFRIVGSKLTMRMWLDGNSEPSTWDLTVAADSSFTTAGSTGLHIASASTNTVSVDSFSIDDTKILKDVITRFRQRSADQLKDVVTRFRQRSADQLKDISARLVLSGGTTVLKDMTTRLRQMSANQPKDVVSRFRQRSANQLSDIAARLRLQSANQFKDIAARLRQRSADQAKDIQTRLRQRSANQLRDIAARLTQISAAIPRDISTRFVFGQTIALRDITSRFRQMSALQWKDIAARLRQMSLPQAKDIQARLRQMSASQFKDVITRFRQRSANQLKDVRSRMRLSPPPDHVLITVWENTDYSSVIGNTAQAPYLNSLISQGILFTNYHAIDHPSEGNYIAMFSGGDQGLTTDTCPQSTGAENVFHQLQTAGLTHKSYCEDLPSVGFTGCTNLNYVRRHNAAIQFTNVTASTSVPFTQFPTDYTTLPTLSVVIPNLQDDLHDGTMAQADAWLQANLDGYIQWAKTHNSLFIFTHDESSTGLGSAQVPLIIVGQGVQPNTTSAQNKDHTNLASTFDLLFSLPSLGPTPITGWYTPVTASVRDIAARFVQRSANQLKDVVTRLRQMSASQLKDIRGRLRQMSAPQPKDVPGRFMQRSANQQRDMSARLRLALLRDIASRLRQRSANQQKDVPGRLRLVLMRDMVTRFRQRSANQLKDISSRLVLALATGRIKDITTRLSQMSALQTKDVPARLRQRSIDQQRDVPTRLRQRSIDQPRDMTTRLRQMSASQLKDIAARLKQISANQRKDVATRFFLAVYGSASRDIRCRLVLKGHLASSHVTVQAPRGKLAVQTPRGKVTVKEE